MAGYVGSARLWQAMLQREQQVKAFLCDSLISPHRRRPPPAHPARSPADRRRIEPAVP